MRFRELLRASVLLFAGAASTLAVISIYGTTQEEDNTLLFVSLGWWLVAAIAGLWMGRRVMFNRLWPLGVFAIVAAAIGIVLPSVPAVATGYALLVALSWRRQASAVEAIEHRDGVEYWLDRSPPFRAPRLVRVPGLRKIEPQPGSEREAIRLR
jgi:hypothetical protein